MMNTLFFVLRLMIKKCIALRKYKTRALLIKGALCFLGFEMFT